MEGRAFYFQNSKKPLRAFSSSTKVLTHVLKSLPRLPCGEGGAGRQAWVQGERFPLKGESALSSPFPQVSCPEKKSPEGRAPGSVKGGG